MTDRLRKSAVLRLKELLESGTLRKEAFYMVITELRTSGHAVSRATLYRWCGHFRVSIR